MCQANGCEAVTIKDLSPAEVLKALQNAASGDDNPLDLFSLPPSNITLEEAEALLRKESEHGVIQGKNVHIMISPSSEYLNVCTYNALNGGGLAQAIIERLRLSKLI